MPDNQLYQKFNEIKQNLTELEAKFLADHSSLSTLMADDIPDAEREQYAKTILFYESALSVISPANAKLEEIITEE